MIVILLSLLIRLSFFRLHSHLLPLSVYCMLQPDFLFVEIDLCTYLVPRAFAVQPAAMGATSGVPSLRLQPRLRPFLWQSPCISAAINRPSVCATLSSPIIMDLDTIFVSSSQPAASSVHAGTSPSPRKKLKRENEPVPQCLDCVGYLTNMPLEIVAEILSYTTPRDILALARANKYFCATLTDPSCAFIWKKARKQYIPAPIPDPTPNFTEASYAAFLFDPGHCEVSRLRISSVVPW